jgi:FeS assembly SUF system protein
MAKGPIMDESEKIEEIRRLVIETIKTVYDPEIPVDIYELGLVYDIDITSDGRVGIKMTLTSPGCPVAVTLPREVDSKIRTIDLVTDVNVEIVWDPPWSPERMSEVARLELDM